MHHRVRNLHARRPCIHENPARSAFQRRHEFSRAAKITLVHLQSHRQLPFELLQHVAHIVEIATADQHRGSAEDLLRRCSSDRKLSLFVWNRTGWPWFEPLATWLRHTMLTFGLAVSRSTPLWNAVKMPGVSMVAAEPALSASDAPRMSSSSPGPSWANRIPGLVQNCPAPIVSDATNACPISRPRAAIALGMTTTGLMLLISA